MSNTRRYVIMWSRVISNNAPFHGKITFYRARLCCEDIKYNQLFNTVFGHSDILSHYSFEVRSSCNCSRLETVDLHKILKFSLLAGYS
jgi:hypothetical protein